jgi:electron-transferring-flavoprotein dehydrogenase
VSSREKLDVDVLVVGAGPAGLAAAIRLGSLAKADGGHPLAVVVVDKAPEPGAHALSGAVLDPSALRDLVPDFADRGAPLSCPVLNDSVLFLTERRSWRFPITPPPLRNHGHVVVSLGELTKWLAREAEAGGVDLINGISVAEVLHDGDRVVGVRTRDLGLSRTGEPLGSFQPGVDIRAKVTILCDGVRGNLTKTLVTRHRLDKDREPQVYSLGFKELWELPAGRLSPGAVVHAMGYPLHSRQFGGGFIYGMPDGTAAIGFVVGLDYEDPRFDPYVAFQRFKQHSYVARLLEGGTRLRYGAKALPEGGWHSIPRVHLSGALIAGDAAGFLNSVRLKGIHLAMRTGMLAAEAAFAAVRSGDTSEAGLRAYQAAIDNGEVRRELYPVRNVHQAFQLGLVGGLAFAGWSLLSGGWWIRDRWPMRPGHERLEKISALGGERGAGRSRPPGPDWRANRSLAFDRTTSVHYSGTRHREDEPSHLVVHDLDVCRTRCTVEYGNPCTRFCPADVYDMVSDGAGGRRLQINASNCVHCKTCDIMDPYQIIDWVPPEGGEGPRYVGM